MSKQQQKKGGKLVLSSSGSTLDKDEICFYYSEAATSHSFMVDPNEKVLDLVPELFQEFVKGNPVVDSLSPSEKSKLTCSILPTVANKNVTFSQLRRLNSGGNPLVLVTVGKESPLVNELLQGREKKPENPPCSLESLHATIDDLKKEIQALRELVIMLSKRE